MGARGAATEERTKHVIDVAIRLLLSRPYDDVSLQSVATEAGVGLKTVVRKFGTKEALLLASAKQHSGVERGQRVVPRGDARAVARMLAARYEELGRAWIHFVALEERIEAVAHVIRRARASHMAWLGEVFADSLPRRQGALREQRLAELFGATEFYVWHSWRYRLGLGARTTERAMTEMLEALLERWKREGVGK